MSLWRMLPGAVATFAVVAFGAIVVACNVHEFGHAVTASALGWEVDRVSWCLPGGGGVEYSRIGTWAGNAQGYAGGLFGAAILLVAYLVVFERRPRALVSVRWYAAGLGVVIWVGPQLLVAVLEGSAELGTDYTDSFSDAPRVFIPLVVAAVAGGPAAFAWRWRAIWNDASDN